MDGQEVHYSSSRSGTIDFSWTMKGNHILKLVAHSTPPLNASPNFRPYDFFVDGQSFFRLPKVFELGVKGTPQAQARAFGAPYPDDIQASEDADLQRAIQESLVDAEQYLKRKEASKSTEQPGSLATSSGTNLLDFGSEPPLSNYGPPPVQYVQAPPPYGHPPVSYGQPPSYAPAPSNHPAPVHNYSPVLALPPTPPAAYDQSNNLALVPAASQPQAYNPNPSVYAPSYPPSSVSYDSNPPVYAPALPVSYSPSTPNTVAAPPNYQNYANGELFSPGVTSTASAPPPYGFPGQQPMHTSDDPFAPKVPSQNEMLTSVLGLYGQAPSTPSTPGAPPQPNFQSPVAPPSGSCVNSSVNFGNTNLSMNAPLSIVNDEEEAPKSAFDKALNSLVNFDDISAPADRDIEKARQKKLEEQKIKGNKSKALPPVANSVVGSGATLTQISQVKAVSFAIHGKETSIFSNNLIEFHRRQH
jgi:hypothetical protein